MKPIVVILLLTGCTFSSHGLGRSGDGGGAVEDADGSGGVDTGLLADGALDGAPDDAPLPIDAPCEGARYTYRLSNVDPCTIPAPGSALNATQAGTYLLDTVAGTLKAPTGAPIPLPASAVVTQTGGGMIRIVSVLSFGVASNVTLRVTGQLPLVIVSRGDVTITGSIDVRGQGASDGSGALDRTTCAGRAGKDGKDTTDASGAGGGGGGAFQGGGGDGGNGGGGNGPKGAKGVKLGMLVPIPLRGGCAGGGGGAINTAVTSAIGGAGGGGGGAFQISSGGTLSLDGNISVSGGGGRGDAVHTGGGGGGSGGAILLEAAVQVHTNGNLTANGGSGASGGGSSTSTGSSGEDGSLDGAVSAAAGDCGFLCDGGNGGDGGAGLAPDGSDASDAGGSGGGGGGGGGVGVIYLRAPSIPLLGLQSPPAMRVGL